MYKLADFSSLCNEPVYLCMPYFYIQFSTPLIACIIRELSAPTRLPNRKEDIPIVKLTTAVTKVRFA